MEDKKLIPRRRVLGLGVALAGLCAGCAVLPAGSTESAVGSQAASEDKAVDKVEKAPASEINSVHLRDNAELYNVYDDSGVVTMYLTVSPWGCHAIRSPLCFRSVMRTAQSWESLDMIP